MENTPPFTPPPAAEPSNHLVTTEDRTVAIIAYLTLIGFLVAVILYGSKKTALGAFHLRQALGLVITAVVAGFCYVLLAFIPIIGWLAIAVMWIGLFALWLIGLIGAVTGQMKPVPLLGEKYQVWFARTFQ